LDSPGELPTSGATVLEQAGRCKLSPTVAGRQTFEAVVGSSVLEPEEDWPHKSEASAGETTFAPVGDSPGF
jgi:hypothetical protein